jgi:hypothetical protein
MTLTFTPRLNVALTRAREALVLVGDASRGRVRHYVLISIRTCSIALRNDLCTFAHVQWRRALLKRVTLTPAARRRPDDGGRRGRRGRAGRRPAGARARAGRAQTRGVSLDHGY